MSGFQTTLHATLEDLSACMEKSSRFLADHAVSEDALFSTHLAIEEIITNTIKYGYDGQPPRDISVAISLSSESLTLTITDDAHPFNPFDQPPPDLTLPADQRPIGGLGIHLVRNMMSTCDYQRCGNKNIVRLTKSLQA